MSLSAVAHLAPDVAIAALYRVAVLAIVVAVGFPLRKQYHWPVAAACGCGIASNLFFYFGQLRWSGLFGVPYVGLVGWVFVQKMRDDPHLMRTLLASKESAWSKERHDLIDEQATLRARLDYSQQKLAEHGDSLPSE